MHVYVCLYTYTQVFNIDCMLIYIYIFNMLITLLTLTREEMRYYD